MQRKKVITLILAVLVGWGLGVCITSLRSVDAYLGSVRLRHELQSHTLVTPSKEAHGVCPEALVLLMNLAVWEDKTVAGLPFAMGFAIGDGSLILTAAHCLTFSDEKNRHRPMSRQVVAVSPFYGDAFDATIVAFDRQVDLAVLRPSWKGHPSLALAKSKDLGQVREVYAATRSCNEEDFLHPSHRSPDSAWTFDCPARMERLSALVTDPSNRDHRIYLGSTRYIANGWSGSPLIDLQTQTVVGVLTQCFPRPIRGRIVSRTASGTNLRAIEAFLKAHGLEQSAWALPASLPAIQDAPKAFDLAVQHVEEMRNGKDLEALHCLDQLLGLRPDSSVVHGLLAYVARQLAVDGQYKDRDYQASAELHFRRAMDLDPNNRSFRIAYGELLRQFGRYSEALVQTATALVLDPNDELALVNRVNILAKIDPNQWFAEARALTEQRPAMAHAWYLYSGALQSRRRFGDALAAARKATDLDPNGLYWGDLARVQDATGDVDSAEVNFGRMTRECGCQRCWSQYADFLIEHHAGNPEGLRLAERALEKVEQAKVVRISATDGRTLRVKLNMARIGLTARSSAHEAELLARDWIGREPNEGHYWWILADLLRTQQRYDEAAGAAQKAMDLDPNGTFGPRLANCLAKAGRLDEAEKTWQQVLAKHPDKARYWFWYAEYLAEHYPDRIEEARKALDKASDPNSPVPADPNAVAGLRRKIEGRTVEQF